MKYTMYEFHEQNGEHEYIHRYIYSDKNLKDMGYDDENDHVLLSAFYLDSINADDYDDSGAYWTSDGMRLVSIYNYVDVKPSQFKTLRLAGVYVEDENKEYEKQKDKGEEVSVR